MTGVDRLWKEPRAKTAKALLPGARILPSLISALDQDLSQPLHRSDVLAGRLGLCLPIGEQVVGGAGGVWCDHALLAEPKPDRVLVGEVLRRGVRDGGRRSESHALPLQAAMNRPGENTRSFGLEALRQVLIGLERFIGEWDEVQASPHGVINIANAGAVITDDGQLEGRLVGEEILAHEPGGYRVAAGQSLDLGLRPAPAFLRLLRGDQARA